jgi:adenylate kinase
MRLILLGPPGSGKGTQAKLLSEDHRLEHIATGDLLREAMRQHSPVGERARPFMASGRLVPDEMINDLIAERFARPDRPGRFLMDGYPRTLSQAAAFDQTLRQYGLKLTDVVLLAVPDEEVVRRLAGRWACPNPTCKASYHTQNKPPKVAGVCDSCGSKLEQREDDRPETVRARLQVYHKNTAELIPHYRQQGLLREVGGTGAIEQVYANILKALTPQAGSPC